MKKKFDNTNNNILGNIIKCARKKKELSQEALGKLVGLPKSSISKIENGKTNISADDATILLEAMGEKLNIQIDEQRPTMEEAMRQTFFVTIATCWFAEDKNVSRQKAYNYLQKNRGIKFLQENWKTEQTLSRTTIVEDLTMVCNRYLKLAKTNKEERRMVAS